MNTSAQVPPASAPVGDALVEQAAEAMWREEVSELSAAARARSEQRWEDQEEALCEKWRKRARAALAPLQAEIAKIEAELEDVSEQCSQWIAKADELQAEIERLTRELHCIADYVEPHWKGAGLALESSWILKEVQHLASKLDDAEGRAEAAERENAELRVALEIIAGRRQCIDNLMSNVDVANAALAPSPDASKPGEQP